MLSCENFSWLSIRPRHVVDAILSFFGGFCATAETPARTPAPARNVSFLARIRSNSLGEDSGQR